ncbi:phage tail family protein [Staphylococcus saprophyticus]|uniref:phage tail domain-containing protein n=1 Tax=Staphylococcus saprophyticus TaxID=29385 RepID=UPI00157C28BD|nr:phage tail domain-containing protein [Staphylococcus saprophyticus]QKQ05994.1 phage tail family protein [Staphylococcus saprophyticus]
MDIEITKRDGTVFLLSKYGIKVKDVIVESIEIDDNYQDKDNAHGRLLLSSQYRKRKITVPAFFKVTKLNDVSAIRDILYDLVVDTESVYLREKRRKNVQNYSFIQPTENDYQALDYYDEPIYPDNASNYEVYVSGKRYDVKCNGVISPQQNGKTVNFTIEFETGESPFAESIGTSLDLEKDTNKELWSYDMGIPFDKNDPSRNYTFENTNGNSVYYFGTVSNNQFNLYKKVTIILGENAKSFRWNLTHSELMKIDGINLKRGDKIVYDGVQTYRNGVPINNEANLSQPEFKHGWNNFEFDQVVKSVEFDMKYYYK